MKQKYLLLLIFITACTIIACNGVMSSTPPATPTTYIVTAMAAILDGKLTQELGRCLRVDEYALVWPPDTKMTIEDGQVRVVSGIVSGNIREVVLKIGEKVTLGGGISNNLDEQLQGTIPDNCLGPYWVVGSVIRPLER